MLINKISDLNGCLKNNEVCYYCIGQKERFPTSISCSRGNECTRGECCFHRTKEQLSKEMFGI